MARANAQDAFAHGEGAALRKAAEALTRDERVLAVYAFGSRARGEASPRSDFDLAVLMATPVSLREELRLRAGVVEALRTDHVDLVLLRYAPPALRYEIVATGRRLFVRDEAAADAFERRAAMECFDTAHLRRTQERLAREAARSGHRSTSPNSR